MKRRRWDSKTKTKIVLEGLSGRSVSQICNEYGIHQNQHYKRSFGSLADSIRRQTNSTYLYYQIETVQINPILRSILEIIWKRALPARRALTLFLKTSQAKSKLRSLTYPLKHIRNRMEADTVRFQLKPSFTKGEQCVLKLLRCR